MSHISACPSAPRDMPASAPDQRADDDGDRHRSEADRERDASAIDHAGENILPEIVGAEGMGERGGFEPRVEIDVVDADAPDERAEHDSHDQDEQQRPR